MSIMDMFRSKPAQQPSAPSATPASVAANPTVPSDASPIQTKNTDGQSSMDKFNKLWESDPNASPSSGDNSLVPNLNLDPAKLREASEKVNFVGHIPQELMLKATQGDVAALGEVINKAVQLGFAQSTATANEISKQHLTAAQTALNTTVLPQALRNDQINKEIVANNPAFQDPMVSPVMENLKQQFQRKYPTAAPHEIGQMANEYMQGLASKIVSGSGQQIVSPPTKQSGTRTETDWGDFLGIPKSAA